MTTGNGTWQVDALATALPARSWQRLSAGAGSRGHRMYSWAWIQITDRTGRAWLLLRRSDTTGKIAYYRTFSPRQVPLRALSRWPCNDHELLFQCLIWGRQLQSGLAGRSIASATRAPKAPPT